MRTAASCVKGCASQPSTDFSAEARAAGSAAGRLACTPPVRPAARLATSPRRPSGETLAQPASTAAAANRQRRGERCGEMCGIWAGRFMACLPVRGGVGASAWVKRTGRCCCCRGARGDDGGGFFALRRWTGVWRAGRSAEPPRRRCRHAPWERQPPPRAPRAMAGAMGSRRAMGVVGRGRGGPVEPSGPQHGQRRQPVPEDGWGWEQCPGPAKAAVPAAQGRRFAGAMKRDTEMKQARAWRSPDNGRKGVALPPGPPCFRGAQAVADALRALEIRRWVV